MSAASQARWRARNPGKDKENTRKYNAAHRADRLAANKLYREANKAVIRSKRIQRQYGLTAEEFDQMLVGQGGGCAICHESFSKVHICVDHDHKTGDVRGLLCQKCNTALGLFGDDVVIVALAAGYLAAHRSGAD
jgi:hypothetical protein